VIILFEIEINDLLYYSGLMHCHSLPRSTGTLYPHTKVSKSQEQGECQDCGFPVDATRHRECPKCGSEVREKALLGLYEVDVAHSGESVEAAKKKIAEAVDRARYRGHSGVKIIHGYGSTSGPSRISGPTVALMKRLAESYGGTFAGDRDNKGASLIWFH
jgi:hypothetical protein